MASGDFIVIFITTKDTAQARTVARKLLDDKLAACVNVVSGVQSLFWWEGKVDEAAEVLLVVKSRKKLFAKLQRAVRAAHSYQVPEIIALPIVAGNKEYLNWIKQTTE